MTAVAYPFVRVTTDPSGLRPTARRAPGVLAVVGATASGAEGGTAADNTPEQVFTLARAAELFSTTVAGVVQPNPLYTALEAAFLQNPGPSLIYGVRVGTGGVAAALASLAAADDVTIVALAGIAATATAATDGDGDGDGNTGDKNTDDKVEKNAKDGKDADATVTAAGATTSSANADLAALRSHVDLVSAQGHKRIGVAMVDPDIGRADYVETVETATEALKSNRMVVVAARGATGDVGVACAAAIAGYPPSVSMVLKPVQLPKPATGSALPLAGQFGPDEIIQLSQLGIVPIIDPALITGESLHFAEGRTFMPGDPLEYIDTVRTLDDIDFRLRAGLIGLIGDARITRSGLTTVKARVEAILSVVQRESAIDSFTVSIPVLDILSLPEAARSPADVEVLGAARKSRAVPVGATVVLGPATHLLDISLVIS